MATGFVQIMEYTTDRFEELQAVLDEWLAATKGKRTARKGITCRDRADANRYVEIVEFDSYESAMENSNLPETTSISEKMAKLCETLTFRDLDVVRVEDF